MNRVAKVSLCIWGIINFLWIGVLVFEVWKQGLVNAIKDNYASILAISMTTFCVYIVLKQQRGN